MSTVQLVIVCVTLLLLAALVIVARGGPYVQPTQPEPPELVGRDVFAELVAGDNVALYLGDGQTLKGTVVIDPRDGIVSLSGASLHSGASATAMGGRVRIHYGNVLAVQEL